MRNLKNNEATPKAETGSQRTNGRPQVEGLWEPGEDRDGARSTNWRRGIATGVRRTAQGAVGSAVRSQVGAKHTAAIA